MKHEFFILKSVMLQDWGRYSTIRYVHTLNGMHGPRSRALSFCDFRPFHMHQSTALRTSCEVE